MKKKYQSPRTIVFRMSPTSLICSTTEHFGMDNVEQDNDVALSNNFNMKSVWAYDDEEEE